MSHKLLLFLIIFISIKSFAYLEPQTGSLLIQSILAFALGAIYLLKAYRHKITNYFKKNKHSKKSEDEQKR